MKVSLGLIEVKGLALAIMVADNMAKCAAIEVVDIENTNGSGWMLIKVTGDVAGVQAAVHSGSSLAQSFGGLISNTVLSNPDNQLIKQALSIASKTSRQSVQQDDATEHNKQDDENPAIDQPTLEETAPKSESNETQAQPTETLEEGLEASCNICQDPACPRKKGDPRVDCIHGGSAS
ncbi:BMC domain-containing protein [Vibrio maritimus]|uniref:BMC domain-containing protein n=1 Tax=Vibrio maritimus TaxID=990268 RepID=UPI003736531B